MRARLPNRRRAMTFEVKQDGQRFTVTAGYYEDGRPGEIFVSGGKIGSALDAILDDASVAISLALQHGITLEALRRSMSRVPDGEGTRPASVVGVAVDILGGRT